MSELVNYGPEISSVVEQNFESKDPKNAKNKAKVKKMIIADPGLLTIIKFEADGDINQIEIIYAAKYGEGDYEDKLKWTISGGGHTLDLSNDYNFAIPFMDAGIWGHVPEVDFKLSISYFQGNTEIPLTPLENTIGDPETEDYLNPNHIIKTTATVSNHIKQTPSQGVDYEFKNPTFQTIEAGVSGEIVPAEDINIEVGFKVSLINQSLSGVVSSFEILDVGGAAPDDVEFKRYMYLPYPRVADDNNLPENYKLDLNVRVDYTTESGFSPESGAVTISLKPQENPDPDPGA